MVETHLDRVTTEAAIMVAVNCIMAVALVGAGAVPLAVAAVLVPGALALVRRPQRGILLLCALIPFDGLLLLAPRLPFLASGWKEALVLATLGATFVAPPAARAAAKSPLPGWAPAVGGLIILGAVSALAVGGLQAFWGLKIAFFFLLTAVILRRCPLTKGERDILVTVLLVTGVITASYGVVQQLMGHGRLHALGYEYDTAIRFSGDFVRSFSSFDNPFGFGYFLMLVLLIGVPHALAEPGRLRSRLFLLSLPILVLGLASSVVRGAWIGLAVGLVYLAVSRFRVLLLGVPVVLVALLLLPTGVSSAAFSSRSAGQRVQAWEANLTAIASHPLGVGLGSSNAAAEKVSSTRPDHRGGSFDEEVFHPDNEYYRAIYELGVVGLWLTVLLLISAFLTTRAAGAASVLALAVSSTVVAAAAASIVTTYFDTFPNNVYFWVLLGAVAFPAAGAAPAAPAPVPVSTGGHGG